jgi:hypothetical protein
MDYIISPEQLDRITTPFFDREFKHAKWGEELDSYDSSHTWIGLRNKDNVILVGYPSYDSDTYYTNGQYFSNMWDLFSVKAPDFNKSLGRYIKKKYGCEFKKII